MAIQLEIKALYSTDLPGAAELPSTPGNCYVNVHVEIGELGKEGADQFTFRVCTPLWLADDVSRSALVLGHGLVIVQSFDWPTVERATQLILRHTVADTWEEAVEQLRRHFDWERDGLKT